MTDSFKSNLESESDLLNGVASAVRDSRAGPRSLLDVQNCGHLYTLKDQETQLLLSPFRP